MGKGTVADDNDSLVVAVNEPAVLPTSTVSVVRGCLPAKAPSREVGVHRVAVIVVVESLC